MFRVILFILLSLSFNAYSFDASLFKKSNEGSIPTQQDALRPVDLSDQENLILSFEPNSGGRLYFEELAVVYDDKTVRLADINELIKSSNYSIKYDEFYGETPVYESKVTFKIGFEELSNYIRLSAGSIIKVTYRGCTTTYGVCYPQDSLEIKIPKDFSPIKISNNKINSGLLLTSVLMGLALSLTPCLYAMIPITLSILKSQKPRVAVFYFFGVLSAYYSIGLLVELNSLKAQRILQNPYIYLFMGVFLIIAGAHYLRDVKFFSTLDVFLSKISSPVNKILSKINSSNPLTLWFSGFLSVFILSSCSVPIILGGLGLIGGQASGNSTLYFTAFGVGSICILLTSYALKGFISSRGKSSALYFKYILSALLIFSGVYISCESASNLRSGPSYSFEYKEISSVDELGVGYLIVTSKNCYYCTKMGKEVYSDKDVVNLLNEKEMYVLDLTISNNNKEDILSKMNIVSYPAIVRIYPHQNEIVYGFINKDELLTLIKKAD